MSFLHWIGHNCKRNKITIIHSVKQNSYITVKSWCHDSPSDMAQLIRLCCAYLEQKTHFAARPESALSYFGLTMQPESRRNRKYGRRNSGSALLPKPTGPSEDLFMMPPVLEKHHKAIPACVEIRNTDSSIHVTCFVFALRRGKNPTGPQSKTCDLLIQETMPRS